MKSPSMFVRLAFALTIFLSAFLLFLVQPLISKIILPWFGGSTGVWATCMVFFQVMLCLGYAYAHFIQRFPLSTQRWCHWGLLGVGLFCLPVMPGEAWKPVDGNSPTLRILLILLFKTGLPYLALSTTGPLLQAWHARLFPQSKTYRLYALSNVASLASLLLFPVWFERSMTLNGMSTFWSIVFVLFVLGCGYVAYCVSQVRFPVGHSLSSQPASEAEKASDLIEPKSHHYFLWLFLPAFASFLLVSGTSHLCQDIASTPFLWILPLCLYLLSFILCFDAPHWYVRRFYVVVGLIGLYGVIAMRDLGDTKILTTGWLVNGSIPLLGPLWDTLNWYSPSDKQTATWVEWLKNQVQPGKFHIDLIGQIALHCAAMFAVFMVCHGELAKRKPAARYLTGFYLMISVGGAMGSAFVSLLAPLIFKGNWEWWFGLTMSVVLFCGLLFQFRNDQNRFVTCGRYLFFTLPLLLIVVVSLWQNSLVPLRFAEKLSGSSVSREPATVESFADELDTEGVFGEMLETSDSESIPQLSFGLTIGLMAGLSFIALLGAITCFAYFQPYGWLNLVVVNVAAIALGSIYVWDSLNFSVPRLFEKPSVMKDLTNKDNTVWRDRNFYGSLTIEESSNLRTLQHGRIVHGTQFIDGAERALPTTYYSRTSGVGVAMEHVSHRPEIHLGAIGLGTGTLASYAAPTWNRQDKASTTAQGKYRLSIYEINQLVVALSEDEKPWFCYLKDARERGVDVKIILGDARLMMERQPPQAFDVLAVDAFSGDSIPVHLLTDEAMLIYRQHLKPDGILAVHISNRYLDLEPVCKALAAKHGYEARVVEDEGGDDGYTSTWVLITQDASLYMQLDDTSDQSRKPTDRNGILWTDAFSSLYEVLMNSDFDRAVTAMSQTAWYQELKSQNSQVELRATTSWWRDEWIYGQVIKAHDSTWKPIHFRYRPSGKDHASKIQRKDDASWNNVE